MIDHVGLNVSDLERSGRFYDALFFALGLRRVVELETAIGYGVTGPEFWVVVSGAVPQPHYGHVAVSAAGKAAVDAAHRAGLGAGGVNEGAPGLRPHYGKRYYAAYLRDPDGLKVEVVSRR
ncbi:MAG: VOC family protein [Conexibacteraceae bacterium]|nr:VOC family protein [Conexibacteraceae bacterium]